MGQIVMVVAADATSQHAVNQALATIEGCEIVLMVLNKASRTDVGTYYGYYADDEASCSAAIGRAARMVLVAHVIRAVDAPLR